MINEKINEQFLLLTFFLRRGHFVFVEKIGFGSILNMG